MFTLLAGASALALTGAATAGGPFFATWLAHEDTLFATVQESTVKMVMKGDSFSHLIMSFEGAHLNAPKSPHFIPTIPAWEVIEHDHDEDAKYDTRPKWMQDLGIFYVGIPYLRRVHEYRFVWNEVELNETTHKEGVRSRKEMTNFAYVSSFPYIIVLDAAETKEGIPLDISYQLVVRISNPYKALFKTENWLETITGEVNRRARNYIGSRGYKQLLSEMDEQPEAEGGSDANPDYFSCAITDLNTKIPGDINRVRSPFLVNLEEKYLNGLVGNYGITIESANLQTIDIVGSYAEELVKASVREYTAEQNAKAVRIEADAQAHATLVRGRADANVIQLKGNAAATSLASRLFVLQKFGQMGALLAQLDAMTESSNAKVIWANNPLIREFPGLGESINGSGLDTPAQLKNFLKDFMETFSPEEKEAA
ncbi:MAG TPA: SPFH domain-containing protein [Candidatus Paceibacterota bacterium]|jgi:regulator of protease activity HflC (stomatin/prohibitin superfamily)